MDKNPAVDAYIAKSADFAKPILNHLRGLVHKACPVGTEVIKWGAPCYEYKGMLCSLVSFKAHCGFGFWKASLLKENADLLTNAGESSAGNIGKLTSLKDLPKDKIIIGWIKEAMQLNDENIKIPKGAPRKGPAKELVVPEYFTAALKKNKKALESFEKFSQSHRKEYVEWITDAKTDATRDKRMAQAIEWLSEGKPHNWKYMR